MADEFRREYSKRLGVLTGGQLQAALSRFGLGKLLVARPAPGGLFGQNVFLTTTSGDYVLRGRPHYDGQFEKERFFCQAIHDRTQAHAPWPFLIERSTDIFGWVFALMPLLPGLPLSDPEVDRSLTTEDRLSIACAMGEYLATIRQATWEKPGEYDDATRDLVPLCEKYSDWFVGRTRRWLGRCQKASDATTEADALWVESVIKEADVALNVPFQPVLVHTDYQEGNVVAERVDARWRICGVFDLGEAYAGDGEYDLARLMCYYSSREPQLLPAFCGAYARARPPRHGFPERLSLYILTDRLIIWEYGQRNQVWFTDLDPKTSFRAWAEPFVAAGAKSF